jgi:hypothetical protein
MYRSIDGGKHMVSVPGFTQVSAFGFGAIKPGKSYPAIYVAGFYTSNTDLTLATWGIWRCDDDPNAGLGGYNANVAPSGTAGTWTNIGTVRNGGTAADGTYADGVYGEIFDIEGDPGVWGRAYVSAYNGIRMVNV